ncbi:MAG: cell division protein ZapE [Gammaproteobacteria bacterium]
MGKTRSATLSRLAFSRNSEIMNATTPANVETAYREAQESGRIARDPAQAEALRALARLEGELTQKRLFTRRRPLRGIYLYGPVGRGKTWLMDLFFRNLKIDEKLRRHFHAFMQEEVHAPLKRLRGERDPLPKVARALSRRARVICFDELLVEDIADAMLLGPLLEALFAEGVALVATANLSPGELYRDGLQRERFLPAIAALESNCEVVPVAGEHDYRAEHIGENGAWRIASPADGESALAALFRRLAGETPRPLKLKVNDRPIHVAGTSEDTLLSNFADLCEGPRSASDYLELARRYRTILIANVPILDDESLDATRRFIALIDVLYESRSVVIATAAAPPESLYRGKRFRFEFKRTASRLEQMLSAEWLGAAHLSRAPSLTPL